MTEQTRGRNPHYDTFRGSSLGPLILICAGIFWLTVTESGPESFIGVWTIGYGVFNWFWSTRFAWRTWWENLTHRQSSVEEIDVSDFHERRVRLAFAHPYVLIHQSFWVMFLMFWATKYPEFLSLHYGVWFVLSVLVLWSLLSLFFRYIGRGELRNYDYVHRFDEKRGKFLDAEALEHRGS